LRFGAGFGVGLLNALHHGELLRYRATEFFDDLMGFASDGADAASVLRFYNTQGATHATAYGKALGSGHRTEMRQGRGMLVELARDVLCLFNEG
jgi:hypothetical protein